MEDSHSFASRLPGRLLIAALVSFALPLAAANPAGPAKPDAGFEWSIVEGTQFNFGDLSIGAGYMGSGPYLDEKNVRRNGLYASLSFAFYGDDSPSRQSDVHEGQILTVAGYRILIEKIIPGRKGTVVLRVWGAQSSEKS